MSIGLWQQAWLLAQDNGYDPTQVEIHYNVSQELFYFVLVDGTGRVVSVDPRQVYQRAFGSNPTGPELAAFKAGLAAESVYWSDGGSWVQP